MKMHFSLALFLVVSGLTVTSDAGGPNKFEIHSTVGDGYIRVTLGRGRTGRATLSDIRMPTIDGTATCKRDGYRVWRVGPKEFDRTKTVVRHTWQSPDSVVTLAPPPGSTIPSFENDRTARLDAACSAGHAAVNINITESGHCYKIKAPGKGSQDIKSLKPSVVFGLECVGYPMTKRPLYLFRHERSVAGKKVSVFNADAGSTGSLLAQREKTQVRHSLEGQLWTSPGPGRREVYRMSWDAPEGKRETLASAPLSIKKLTDRGYKQGTLVGWVSTTAVAGTVQLMSFQFYKTQDAVTAARPDTIQMLLDRGYKFARTEGYIPKVPNL